MGAGKNVALSSEPIMCMMESKEVCNMKKTRYYVTLNAEETRLVLRSLIRMKNKLTAQGSCTDRVDELIAKIAYA